MWRFRRKKTYKRVPAGTLVKCVDPGSWHRVKPGDTMIWLHEAADEMFWTWDGKQYPKMIMYHPLTQEYPKIYANWNEDFGFSYNKNQIVKLID